MKDKYTKGNTTKKQKTKKKTNQVSNVYVRLDKLKLENASFFGFLG